MEDIVGEDLVACDVAQDGSRFRLSVAGSAGETGSLTLPTECLQSLIMTLPKLMATALKARFRDDSLRLVYPVEQIRIEQASAPDTMIVTLATPDGFEVAFALTTQQMQLFQDAGARQAQMAGRLETILN